MKPEAEKREATRRRPEAASGELGRPNLQDPKVVLSLLEADQIVAAKNKTRFGPSKLSTRMRVILWGLRVYVLVMMVIVLVSVLHALRLLN